MMGESVYIYSLNCPDTGEVKYVGKAIDRKNRLNSHISGNENFKKYADNFRKMRKHAIKLGLFDEFELWLISIFGRNVKNET